MRAFDSCSIAIIYPNITGVDSPRSGADIMTVNDALVM